MFCVIYRFRVKPGQEERLIASWSAVTRQIYAHCGSLGSRLHRAGADQFVAYAQWPSREAWAASRIPESEDPEPRRDMRASCESIETLFELEPVVDLLADAPARAKGP